MKKQAKELAYLLNCFPSLTTTFVYREVGEVRNSGMNINLFSIHKPTTKGLSPESRRFLGDTHYLLPPSVPVFLFAHLYYLLRRPITYLSLILMSVFSSSGPRGAWRSLLHFGLAVYTAKLMERRQIGHIHAHFASNAASVAFFASKLMGGSFSFTVHAFDLFADRLLLKEKIRAAKFVVAISEYNRQHLIRYVPDAAEKIKVVHCGIDISGYNPSVRSETVRRPKILAIGQLAEKKGFIYLIEALKVLAEEGVPFHCTILGDGPQKEYLSRMVALYGLQDQVWLAGAVYQEVAKSYLSVADVFILPCVVASNEDRDGIPVALMEAMAMGLPVVSTNISGIPELIDNEESGILVPQRDAIPLAAALIRLITDPGLRKRLGVSGREKIIADFNLTKSALLLKTLFEGCLGIPERSTAIGDPRPIPLTGARDG